MSGTGKQSANFRQNMLVPQTVQGSTTVITGDAYKVFTSVNVATMTLPAANVGSGPFYFNPIQNLMTVTPRSTDSFIGLGPGVSIALAGGTFFGVFCLFAGVWSIVDGYALPATAVPSFPGGVTIVTSTTSETRASTTVPTNSTHLFVSVPTAGTYKIEVFFLVKQAAAGAVGCNVNLNFNSTLGSINCGTFGCGSSVTGFGAGGASPYFGGAGSGGTLGVFIATSTTAVLYDNPQDTTFGDEFYATGYFSTTNFGTLSLAFAQNTSSATVLTLLGGTMILTRIA